MTFPALLTFPLEAARLLESSHNPTPTVFGIYALRGIVDVENVPMYPEPPGPTKPPSIKASRAAEALLPDFSC